MIETATSRLLPLALALLALAGCDRADLVQPEIDAPAPGSIAFTRGGGQAKVVVCHYHRQAVTYQKISVAAPALPAHTAHGDLEPGDALPNHAGWLDADCKPTSIVLDLPNTYDTRVEGGGGGATFRESCPAGSVAVGVGGSAGGYFGWAALAGVYLHCRQLRPDGSLATASTTGAVASGRFFSGAPFSGSCTDGALVAVDGRHGGPGGFVSRLGGGCATVTGILEGSGTGSTIGPWAGSGALGFNSFFLIACEPGEVITGMIGRAGDVLDAVGYTCTPLIRQRL
jgi:hypothetical protein